MSLGGICVDASHLTKRKVTEYRGVITDTGEEIFRKKIKYTSVNCGEYLGLIHGIKWLLANSRFKEQVIWCDSLVAINWFNQQKHGSGIKYSAMMAGDFFLKAYWEVIKNKNIEVRHWNKRIIGFENPADFGRK